MIFRWGQITPGNYICEIQHVKVKWELSCYRTTQGVWEWGISKITSHKFRLDGQHIGGTSQSLEQGKLMAEQKYYEWENQ